MTPKLLAGAALAALALLALPAHAADAGTIYDTLAKQDSQTVLAAAVKEAGEVALLRSAGPYTLFAPTDDAFKDVDDPTIGAIATKKEVVKQLVRAHVVAGKFTAADLVKMNGKVLKTLNGVELKVEATKDGLRVGGVKVTRADIECRNGVIHMTDAVLPIPKG